MEKNDINSRIVYPIRILCVFSTLNCGGSESMCMNLYRHIDRSKIQFDFVKHTHCICDFENEISLLGGKVYEAPRLTIKTLLQYILFWKHHLKNHPEHVIIHGHFFTISPIYFFLAQKKKRITIGHIHASVAEDKLKKILVKYISRYTDYPLACSVQAGKWIYGDRSFKVLKNGIDSLLFKYSPEKRKVVRANFNIKDEKVIGIVANLLDVKNPMGVIDIFLAVRNNYRNIKLMWIGEGNQRPIIEERISAENIKNDVLLLGHRTDVPDLLQAMDCFILPSYSEGLPVSVIEAQAAGLPCFLSDSITKEINITGLCHFIPFNSYEKWADAIINCSDNREDTSNLIQLAGYDIRSTSQWLQNYYLDIFTKRINSLY